MTAYPLQRFRMVDFTWVYAGPVMTRLLADMGAEVIRVESKKRMDGTRLGRPIIGGKVAEGDRGEWPELQPLYHSLNRSKRGVTVDLTSDKGLALLKGLIAQSDAVSDNFNAGVMERHGLGYEELRKIRPDIICISLSGTGQHGPWRDVLAYNNTILPLSGIGVLVGYPGDPPLGLMHGTYADTGAATQAFFALMVALHHRERTGRGQFIDLSEWEAAIRGTEGSILEYVMNQRTLQNQGSRHPLMAPHGNYKCNGDDKWVAIAVRTDEEWRGFCETLGNPAWTKDPQFADLSGRLRHAEELDRRVTEWTQQLTPREATDRLQACGVAAFPVMNIEDQYLDQHFHQRRDFLECDHPKVGIQLLPGVPWKFSQSRVDIWRHAPLLGQDNSYVFEEVLGLAKDQLASLDQEGVLT